MKKSIALVLLTATILCIGAVGKAAESAQDKSTHASKSESKHKQMPFRGKVTGVDKTLKTITLEGKEKSRTFQITSATKITKDGKPAVMDDVVVGRSVVGMAKETAEGKWEVVTLNVGAPPGKSKGEKSVEKK